MSGNAHPYLIYEEFGVPMVISTDDSGVSRNNLTNEYVLLASRYQPSYAQVKEYVYNSIKFSFMNETDKQTVLQRLDKQFIKFEAEVAKLVAQKALTGKVTNSETVILKVITKKPAQLQRAF